ncbi:WD repeat-containing protein 87-like isoform X1 [Stylophora pistillata]|uniref:WD repeat-containing protein 87-like isoform X1 n=1 Tax=Stylophora pistillata TaxID=50429 RepID=UPI000C043448|nr:WD repeat-containing protein 87-like isoform X1 [Stylophora pistillata]
MEVRRRKPFKICNSARTKALGIVAESLREVKEIASLKFGSVAANCRVCLNSDGTEIDNEEYFSFLEDQTKLMIVCGGEEWTDDLLGGKEKETNTKSRKGKTLSTRAEGRETEVARDASKLLEVKTNKSNAFATNFALENGSSGDDVSLIERLNQFESPLVNKRKATEQAKKSTPQGHNLQAVNNLIKRHSLKEQRMAHASVSSSREAVLCASTYESLFTVPKHSRPRRKGALETSALKVTEWLCTNNVSPTLDEQDSDSDEGAIVVGSNSTVSEENRVDEEPATVAIKRDDGGDSDDGDDDGDDDDDDEEEEEGSSLENEDNESSGCCMVDVDCKERPPTERMVRFPGKDVELQTCRVKIYKLPVSLGNGRPRVVENCKIIPGCLAPIKILPEGPIVFLKERNTVTKTTAEQEGEEEDIIAFLEGKRNQEVRTVDSNNVVEEGNSVDHEFVAEKSSEEKSKQKEEEEDDEHGPGVQRSIGYGAIKDVLELMFEGNETVIQQSKRSMGNDVELESVTQDSDEKQSERNKERVTENKREEECEDDFVETVRTENCNDGVVASNIMVDETGDQEQVIEDFTEKEGDKNEKQAGLKGDDFQLMDTINGERANGKMEGSKDALNRVVDGNVQRAFVTQNASEECDEMRAENVELDSQNAVEETFNVEHGNSGNEAENFSYDTAMKSYEEYSKVASTNEVRKENVELEVVTQNPTEKTSNFEQKKSGDKGVEDMSVEDVDTFVRNETAEECTNLGLENERGKKFMGNVDALVKNVDGGGVDCGNEEEVVTIDSAANTGERQNGTKTKEDAPQKNVTQDLGDSVLISGNTAEENGEGELSARKKTKKNEGKLEMNNDQLATIVHQERVGDQVNNSENTLVEETVQPELLTKKPNEKKTKHKKKRKERNKCELVKNAAIKYVDDHASVAGETIEGDVESTLVIRDCIANNEPRKRKKKRLKFNEENPVESSVEQFVSDKNLVSKKTEKNSGKLYVTQESGEEQSEDVLVSVNGLVNAIDETAAFTKSTSKDVEQRRNEKKSKRKKKKETENERMDEDRDDFVKDGYQGSCDNGVIASKGVAEETIARFCEDEREEEDKKGKDKKRKLSHGNDGEGNHVDHIEKKKKRKTEEKRKSREKKGESETERIPALLNLGKAESLDDSGYSENLRTVFKPSHPRATEESHSVTESTGSQKKKDKASVKAAADQGTGKKKSKTLFSLLDLALDDTAGPKHSSTPSNLKTPLSEGRSFSEIRRHFRDKPKGFLRVVQNRKRSTPIRTSITMRKPRTEPRRNFNREKVKGVIPSNVSFDQALEDYLWET